MNVKKRNVKRMLSMLLAMVMLLGSMSVLVTAESSTIVKNLIANGNMSETTNGALTYWMPQLKMGCDDNTIAQYNSTTFRYGSVNLSRYNGAYAILRPNTNNYQPYECAFEQLMIQVPDGIYTLSAYVYSNTTAQDRENGGYAQIYAYGNDGWDIVESDLPVTSNWTKVTLPNIEVTNGKCRVGFALKSLGTDAATARCLAIDNVELTYTSATLQGVVTDAEERRIPDALVEVLYDGKAVASSTTDAQGGYGPILVPADWYYGSTETGYTIRVSKAGYPTLSLEGYTFAPGQERQETFQFAPPETAYYIDSVTGSDDNDGLSPQSPWKSVEKFNATTFQPGDMILFKAGSVWEGVTLQPKGDGTVENPIVLGKYGDGDKYPVFHANYAPGTPLSSMTTANKNALNINGISNWIIRDLELTNYSLYNNDMILEQQKSRRAVTITTKRNAVTANLTLDGLYIHDVNGWNAKANADNGCGISFGANSQGYFDGLTIQNCILKNISRDGITGGGYTGSRPWGWGSWDGQSGVPVRHKNVAIRNNVLDTITGDGIVVTGTNLCVVEYNLVTKACNNPRRYENLSGNAQSNLSAAVWPFDADNTVFQYNEVCYSKVPRGTEVADGQAFDSDYYCVNSLYQYNYSHNNEGGLQMICGPAYSYTDGTVVRYNISENDGSMFGKRTIFEIGGGGGVNRSYIYNNTIYTGKDHAVFSIVRGEPWDGKPKGTHFYNNIFYIDGMVAQFGFAGDPRDMGKEGIVEYSNNLYYGNFFENGGPKDMPQDPNAVFGDPKLVAPGTAGDGYENTSAYQIKRGSAAIGAGRLVDPSLLGQRLHEDSYRAGNGTTAANKAVYFHVDGPDFQWQEYNGGMDFFGNPIPSDTAPDIGAHQFSTSTDYENLEELYADCLLLEESDYMPVYWAVLQSAMHQAYDMLEQGMADQTAVNAVEEALRQAVAGLKRQGILSISAESEEVTASQPFHVTVVTSSNLSQLRLYNEYDRHMGATVVSKTANGDDTTTWVLKTSVETPGEERFLLAKADVPGGKNYPFVSGFVQLCVKPQQANVLSAAFVKESAPVNVDIEFTVVTSAGTSRIEVYNHTGRKMGIALVSKETKDGTILWVYRTQVGTAGTNRTFNVYPYDKSGNLLSDQGAQMSIDIIKV